MKPERTQVSKGEAPAASVEDDEIDEGVATESEGPTRKKKVSAQQKKRDSAIDDDDALVLADDILEFMDDAAKEFASSAPSSGDEEEEEEESDMNDTSEEEEEEQLEWEESDVSEVSDDALERRYVLGTESFTRLKDPGLADALILKADEEPKPEKTYKGKAEEKHDYKKNCEELGVAPVSKFLQNIHNTVMDLSWMGLNPKSIHAICESLCNNVHVQTLRLRGNDCSGEGGEGVAELLQNNYTIHNLDLARTNVKDSMKKICEACTSNFNLEVLDISRNDLTDKEMQYVSLVLREGALKAIYLSRNYIMDAGLLKLSKGLKENTTLEIIDLSFNSLWGEKDSLPFYANAAKHGTLKHLNLEGNSIKDPGGKAIANIMSNKINPLEYLNVSFNLLTHASAIVLGKSFAASKTTKELIAGLNRWNMGPLTQGYLTPMIQPLTGPKANPMAELLDLSVIASIHQQFKKPLETIKKKRPEIKIIHGEPFGFNEGNRPDMHELLIRRLNVICENFETPLAMLIDELRTEPPKLSHKLFKKFIKSCNLYKDRKMTKELIEHFAAPGGLDVDCAAIIAAFDKTYPAKTLKRDHAEEEGETLEVDGTISSKNMEQLLKW